MPKDKSHSHFMHQEKFSLHPPSNSDRGQEAGAGYTGPASSQHESLQASTQDRGVTVPDSLLCSRQGSALPLALQDRNPPGKRWGTARCFSRLRTARQQTRVEKELICLETRSCCQADTKTTLPMASRGFTLFVPAAPTLEKLAGSEES